MRATLTQDGTLTIAPETPLEAYALERWKEGQSRRGKGHKSALSVETKVQTMTPSSTMPGTYHVGGGPPLLFNGLTNTTVSDGMCP